MELGPNEGHGCHVGCGNRAHGICGEEEDPDGGNEMCATKKAQASPALSNPPKRKEVEVAFFSTSRAEERNTRFVKSLPLLCPPLPPPPFFLFFLLFFVSFSEKGLLHVFYGRTRTNCSERGEKNCSTRILCTAATSRKQPGGESN